MHRRRASLIACAAGLLALGGCAPRDASYRNASLSPDVRAADLLARMTSEEKFWQLFAIPDDTTLDLAVLQHGVYGLQVRPGPGGGAREVAERINALQRYFVTRTRLGIPMIPWEEGLHGLAQGGATVFPQAIALAATWDSALVARVAAATAREARERGIRQLLSPVLNVATDVRWGRTEETFGEDPQLASQLGVAFVHAVEQAGVVTTPKHFVANVGEGGRDSYPIDLDGQWLDALHFPPFRSAIAAGGARSVMASYNSVNGAPASASRFLLTETLRTNWGFTGVVMSDAGGVGGANVLHMTAGDYPASAQRALEVGLDVILQTSASHAALFRPAFEPGRIPRDVIDRAVLRVLRLKFELGLFEQPYVRFDSASDSAMRAEHRALAAEAARASFVLLHNDGQALPLRSPRRIALIGVDADEARLGGYAGPGERVVSIRAGLESRLRGRGEVRYAPGPGRGSPALVPVPASALGGGLRGTYFPNITLAGAPSLTRTDATIDFTWPFGGPDSTLAYGWYSARWEGTLTPPASGPLTLAVEGNDGVRLYVDGRLVIDRWHKRSYSTASITVPVTVGRDIAIRLEYFESTGAGRIRLLWDHATARDWRGDIARAAALARESDVAVVVAGIEEGEFRDRASLRLPGHQEALIDAVIATGRPVVVVLIAGSAVITESWRDRVGALVQAWYPGEAGGEALAALLLGDSPPSGHLPITVPRAEGQLPLSYFHRPTGRGDDYLDLTGRPAFAFGHGLGYSAIAYDSMIVAPTSPRAGQAVVARIFLRNTGERPAHEVVQLYLRDEVASVARPVLALAGSARVSLAAGASRTADVVLPAERFALINAALARVVEPGRFILLAGPSSADARLRAVIDVRAP
ncbi:MAG: glycoside hydrolase family 3 C-terminal domain-containing protein [Gemmatimonadaceae bacterium]|nr:glycoside hydrolase family 3 C-terminal domain-containing protein [Gemmatimonadaceae bacterium]